jgi:hypothetical protein
MENFTDIISKLDQHEQEVQTPKSVPKIKHIWKQTSPDEFVCKLTGRRLSKVQFKIHQDRTPGGTMGFLVETLQK